jgi:hypothetical protein
VTDAEFHRAQVREQGFFVAAIEHRKEAVFLEMFRAQHGGAQRGRE